MKKAIYLISIAFLGILITTWYSCEEDPEETCFQDEICANIYVTACCTENECVYKYNGKEYDEDQEVELLQDTGCTTAVVALKSESLDDDLAGLIEKLRALMDRAKKNCKACK
ncbi:MAG: hypothetical protein JSV22_09665 [Bacteroidales bacterium]|nr:MAG: hypothetical protein JSV22_09665 [Bacteroidales bacterium]